MPNNPNSQNNNPEDFQPYTPAGSATASQVQDSPSETPRQSESDSTLASYLLYVDAFPNQTPERPQAGSDPVYFDLDRNVASLDSLDQNQPVLLESINTDGQHEIRVFANRAMVQSGRPAARLVLDESEHNGLRRENGTVYRGESNEVLSTRTITHNTQTNALTFEVTANGENQRIVLDGNGTPTGFDITRDGRTVLFSFDQNGDITDVRDSSNPDTPIKEPFRTMFITAAEQSLDELRRGLNDNHGFQRVSAGLDEEPETTLPGTSPEEYFTARVPPPGFQPATPAPEATPVVSDASPVGSDAPLAVPGNGAAPPDAVPPIAGPLAPIRVGDISIPLLPAMQLTPANFERLADTVTDLKSNAPATWARAMIRLSEMGPGVLPQLMPLFLQHGKGETETDRQMMQRLQFVFDRVSAQQSVPLQSRLLNSGATLAGGSYSPEDLQNIERIVQEADLLATNPGARDTRMANANHLLFMTGGSMPGLDQSVTAVQQELANPQRLPSVIRVLAADAYMQGANAQGRLEEPALQAQLSERAVQLLMQSIELNPNIVNDERMMRLLARNNLLENAQLRAAFQAAGGNVEQVAQLRMSLAPQAEHTTMQLYGSFLPQAGAPRPGNLGAVDREVANLQQALNMPSGPAQDQAIANARRALAGIEGNQALAGADAQAARDAATETLARLDLMEMATGADNMLRPWGFNNQPLTDAQWEHLDQLLQVEPSQREAANHDVIELVVQSYRSATNAEERHTALETLRNEVQRGNISAVIALRGLSTLDACLRLTEATNALQNGIGDPQAARDAQRRALVDLAQIALAERRGGEPTVAGEILDHLTQRPLPGINPLQVQEARQTAAAQTEARQTQAMEALTEIAQSTTQAGRETGMAQLNTIVRAQIAAGADPSLRPVLTFARHASDMGNVRASLDNPQALANSLTQLDTTNFRTDAFLTALSRSSEQGRLLAEAIRTPVIGREERIATVLQNPQAREALQQALSSDFRQTSMLSALRGIDALDIVGGQGNLEQLFREAQDRFRQANQQADNLVEQYLMRDTAGRPARTMLLGQLPDGGQAYDATGLTPEQRQQVEAMIRLRQAPDRACALMQTMLDNGSLTAEQVTELRGILQQSGQQRRDNALASLNQLSRDNLHLSMQYETPLNALQSLENVGQLHARIQQALAGPGQPTPEALREILAGLEQLQRQSSDNHMHPLSTQFLRAFMQGSGVGNFNDFVTNFRQAIDQGCTADATSMMRRLRDHLPDGRDQADDFRALRLVRDIGPDTALDQMSLALQRLNDEIENSRLEGRVNRSAEQWRSWVLANEAVMRLSRASTDGNADAARRAVETLTTEARGGNPYARSALAATLVSQTGDSNTLGYWFRNNPQVEGRPLYIPNLQGMDPTVRREIATSAAITLTAINADTPLGRNVASAVTIALARDAGGADALHQALTQFVDTNTARPATREMTMNAIMDAIDTSPENTSELADYYLRGLDTATIAEHLPQITEAARRGDRASMCILAALVTGAGDGNAALNPRIRDGERAGQEQVPISQRARRILEDIAVNPEMRTHVVDSLLHTFNRSQENAQFRDNRGLLATLGTIAANLPADQYSDAIRNALRTGYTQALTRAADNPDNAAARSGLESASQGFFAVARRWNAQDAQVFTPENLRPEMLAQLRAVSPHLNSTVAREIINRFGSQIDAESPTLSPRSEGTNAERTLAARVDAVRMMSALAEHLNAADVQRIARYGTTAEHNAGAPGAPAAGPNGDQLLTAIGVAGDANRNRFRAECSAVLLQVLARGQSVLPGLEDGPRELAFRSFATNPWPMFFNGVSGDLAPATGSHNSRALRDALVAYARGEQFRPELAEQINIIVDNARIPRPSATILMDYGIPRGDLFPYPGDPPNVFEISREIIANYSTGGRNGEQVFRQTMSNLEMMNALPGDVRARLMGWDQLTPEQREGLTGWRNEPEADERGRMGWDRMTEEQRTRWRWENVKINPQAVIGQMFNNVLQDSSNAVLLQDVPTLIRQNAEQARLARDNIQTAIRNLEQRRENNLDSLVTMTRNGVSFGTRLLYTLAGNNGIDPDFAERQERLARSFGHIRNQIRDYQPRLQASQALYDGIEMTQTLGRYLDMRNTGDMVGARNLAMSQFHQHGVYLQQLNPRIWQDLNVSRDNTLVGASLYRQMHTRGQAHWSEIPTYARPPAGAPDAMARNRDAFRAILGLGNASNASEPRGLLQLRSGLQDTEALRGRMVYERGRERFEPGYMFRALHDDPVLAAFQRAAGNMSQQMQEFNRFLEASRQGHIYEGGLDVLREHARFLDRMLTNPFVDERGEPLRDENGNPMTRDGMLGRMRERITTMQEALTAARAPGSTTDAETIRQLEESIKTYQQMHDMLNPNVASNYDRRSVMEMRNGVETTTPVLDERGREVPRNPYGNLRRAVDDVLQGRVTASTFSNWLQENAVTIGATIAAAALTVAACATFGVTAPLAVGAWVAVAGLVAREVVNEIFYHVNNGQHGLGTHDQ